jgi:tetratricopeptide (TPR) repeat protein
MDPDGFAYLIRRARYAAAVGQPATAARALSRACRTEGLTLPSLRAWCSARRIDLAMLTATPSEARRLLGRALRRTPDDPALQAALAEAAYADGSLDEARRTYERLAAAGGEEAHLWLARIAVRRHDLLAADSHRVRFEAIARDPRWGRAWWSPLSEMLAESGRVDEALALARRDVRQRPGPEAWHTMATILWRAGRTAEAREAVLRAQGWTPRDRALAALRDSIDRVSP